MTQTKPALAISFSVFLLLMIFHSSLALSLYLGGFSLKLIPRDHPTSPLYPGKLSKVDRLRRLNKFSEARVSYLLSTFTPDTTIHQKAPAITLQNTYSSFYTAEVEIGNPPTKLHLIVDTARDVTWTQCKPCVKCYNQDISVPIYDSENSSSYLRVPDDDPICSDLGSRVTDANNRCYYYVKYGKNVWTQGYLSFESLRVSQDTVLENMVFGCSYGSNLGLPVDTKISGIMGLGRSPLSMISQFPDIFRGRYSYCLRAYQDSSPNPFYISFGDNIPSIPDVFLHTIDLIVLPSRPYILYLPLVGISVVNSRLQLSSDTFQIRDDNTGGLIIDSAFTIPTLDTTPNYNPYGKVMSSFKSYYDLQGLTSYTGVVEENYKLCYKYDKDFKKYASMTYHFEGDQNYLVKEEFTNSFFQENNHFCVAIMGAEGISSLGALHQQDMQLIFDFNHNELHFASKSCQS